MKNTNPGHARVLLHAPALAASAWVMLLLLALTPARAALDPTTDKILYEVATAHLDTQWNWTIQNTINSYIPSTLTNNFNFFAKYTNYVFSFEGAFRYRLAKEYYPDWYATLTNYVAQGRWRVAGSAVDAGDVNVPSPESLMRHVLYGNGFWKQEFGKTSTDIFLPDCFGFPYTLPSVAAHCGLNGFSSQKLSWGSAIPIPFQNIGKWVGPDGSSVVAALQPGGYTSTIGVNLANDLTTLNRITNMGAATGLFIDYRYFGTGDVGGAPTEASVNWLNQSVATTNGLLNVLSAASDQLFRDLTPANISQLPVYQGELLMRTHGSGCYTAHPEMKQYNRLNEQRADAAERVAVIADWLQAGGTYPQDRLGKAWQRFLWHQFHDDLTGTSIPAAYTFSWNDELLSLNDFAAEESQGAGMLAKALDTSAAGVPLVVYNPLSIARQDVVEAVVQFTNTPAAVRVFDSFGVEVPSQVAAISGSSVAVTFLASVPAVGAAVFDVRPSATPCTLNTGLTISTSQLENSRYRVQVNAAGDVSSIFDKVNNRELLKSPIRWAFLPDSSTSWPAWEIQYASASSAPNSYLGGTPVLQIVESGPARAALSITRDNAGSVFSERVRLAAGAAGDRVEWDVVVKWGSLQTLLKAVFPLAITNSFATYDLGLGTIQRTNSTSSLYEVPAQQWADLSASNAEYGVSIMNDSRYGWDKPDNNTLRMTVFHTPAVGGSYVYQATNGIGTHHLGFAVAGHAGDWRTGQSPWAAARFNQPLQAFQTVPHAGTFGRAFGFLSCDNTNVMVKAVKKAEQSNEIIVRLQELSGQSQTVRLSCISSITAARKVTGAEDPISPLTPSAGALTVSLGAYQPMTVALAISPAGSPVVKPSSLPLTLPFNLDAASSDANRTDGNFDSGYSYPAELWPASFLQDGITYQLGPTADGALNTLSCQGQTISLPAGYDRLFLLAAAATNGSAASFSFGGQSTNLTVRYFSGFYGQWNPPALKHDEVAWVFTHRHTGGGANDAYRFCYLYKYRLDLPPGATSLTLPNAPGIRIFAASLGRNTAADTFPAGGTLVRNEPPWANAGPDLTINSLSTNTPATVTLNGSASADPDGFITSYAWTENGVLLATGPNPTLTLSIGTHTLLLTVTDNQGATGLDVVTVTIQPPIDVHITASPASNPSAPALVQFTSQVVPPPSAPAAFDTTDDHTGTISARGQNSGAGEVAANAFDNSASTKWLDFSTNVNKASWIQYAYANGIQYVVTNYTITSANDYPDRDPAAWRLLGSNDGGSSWTTLDIRTNQVFSSRFQKLAFSATNLTAYAIYRLQIDSVANPATANSVQLAEIEFIGNPVLIYRWNFGDGLTATTPNPQHTFTTAGSFLVSLVVNYAAFTGSNGVVVSVGAPLAATLTASATNGATPLTVQFTGNASGGNGARALSDTTDDRRGTVTAQGDNPPNEIAPNAFDNSTATKWLDYASAFPATRSSWIQYQYANNGRCLVISYSIASANDSPERDPANWRLLGSTDAGASWLTLDVQTNQLFPSRFQTLYFAIANPVVCDTYRLQIDSVANPATANSVQLSEIQLIGTPAYTYLWLFGDGSSSTAQNPQHTFANAGSYLVNLVVFDGAAYATNSVVVNTAPVSLGWQAAPPGSLTLSWPAWAANASLYSTTNLAPPASWALVTNNPVNLGGTLQVIIPIGPGSRFFQLRSP